jgi:uncharacterized protein YjbI with pentapeptide repeats
MNAKELVEILKSHRQFVKGNPLGQRADLKLKDLSGLKFGKVVLESALLAGANLSRCNLAGANLHRADLFGADLRGANLRNADLSEADLRGAKFQGCDLFKANLSKADMRPGSIMDASVKVSRSDMSEEESARAQNIQKTYQTPT